MKNTRLTGLIGLLLASPSFSASIYGDDVVISATRTPVPRESLVADVSVVTQEEIRQSGALTLTDVLRTQSSIEIQSNGGMGQVSAVHLRGNSSQSAVVLLDGIRIGSATVGLTAFERIPVEQIERIEIVRGATSSLYGSDAIGGVIQIFTKKASNKPSLNLFAGYGTYNTRETSIGFANKIQQTSFSFNLSNTESDGFSTFRRKDGTNDDRDPYRNLSFSANLSHQITQGHDIGLSYFNSNNNLHFDDDSLFRAKIRSAQIGFSMFSHNQITDNWMSKIKVGESKDSVRSQGSFSGLSIATTHQRQYTWLNDFSLPLGVLTLGMERLEQRVDGNPGNVSYQKESRDNNGYFAVYTLNRAGHNLQLSGRRDYNSQFGQYSTGNLAYGYQFTEQLRAFGSIGTAFRAPTFNDLYWPFQSFGSWGSYQGNPNLVPEKSTNREISLVYDQGHHRLSATIFHNKVRDLIIPAQGLFDDFPINAGEATLKGVNFAYEGWVDNFHIKGSADIQSPRNDDTNLLLPRRSQHYGALALGYRWDGWNFLAEVIGSGDRYDDAANTRKLDGYALMNLTARYQINPELSLQMKANNIFDKEYALSTLFGSPFNTPGANLFIGLRYSPDINTQQ
jgi:vitamin B12 transporter